MNAKTQAKYDARARIIKAMAHPTRLFIVDELARSGPRCVCELTEMVGVDMSTVSRHLAMLKKAGIIEDQKRGAQVYYSLRVQVRDGLLRVRGVGDEVQRQGPAEAAGVVGVEAGVVFLADGLGDFANWRWLLAEPRRGARVAEIKKMAPAAKGILPKKDVTCAGTTTRRWR